MSSLGARTDPAQDKRERLLEAAEAVFCRLGYAGTTIAELAAEAGVTRPTVYTYFPSKDDVFSALAGRVRDEFLVLQEQADTTSPAHTARQAVTAYLAAYTRHRGVLTVIAHQALADGAMRQLWAEIFVRAERRNTRFLERLAAGGQARPAIPPADLSPLVTGMVARAAEQADEDPSRAENLAEQVATCYLRLAGIDGG